MADHIWTVLCQKVLADKKTETISLIDVTESLSSEGLAERLNDAMRTGKKGAALNVELQLVSWWFRSDPKEVALHARFIFLSPSGETLFSQEARRDWANDSTALRLFVDINRLPITEFGLYWFAVEQQRESRNKKTHVWATEAKIPLHIESV